MVVSIIQELLGDLYRWYVLEVDLADVGHSGASRKKNYIVIALKSCRMLANPKAVYQAVAQANRAQFKTRPRDYLFSDWLEIQCEALEVASATVACLGFLYCAVF